MNEIGNESSSTGMGIANIIYILALIGVNIGIFNLFPIPALDGGRILFLGINWICLKTIKREINKKWEHRINSISFGLLFGLMIFVLITDVVQVFFL
jgi:regulator of sigma E protease